MRRTAGDDKSSWAFDGARAPNQGTWHNGERPPFGVPWKIGDILGCLVDIERGGACVRVRSLCLATFLSKQVHACVKAVSHVRAVFTEMSFSMNGDFSSPMGVAFRDIVFVGGISPAITANNKSKFRFNFGQKRSVRT